MLEATVAVRRGTLALDVALEVGDGEVVAVVGPNGAGKSTLLRCLAGLEPIAAGHVELAGRVLDDPGTGTFVPPQERGIGLVVQDYLLFPHLSALENVAFGLRAQGVGRAESRRRAASWLDRFGLAGQHDTSASALSGGQAQRVAVARALAVEPKLLLLDEPLAALDVPTATELRRDLRHDLGSFSGARLIVTHDPTDAAVLADRLVVIEDGRVTQHGTLEEIATHPATPYVADLLDLNRLDATKDGERTARLSGGQVLTVADALPEGPLAIVIRPRAVALHAHHPDGSPRNVWEATVADIEADRERVRVRLAGPVPLVAEVTASAIAELGLEIGGPVWAAVKAVDVAAHPR